jgi:bacteriocin biosynthesis cyclodehydratase domain-containing protein
MAPAFRLTPGAPGPVSRIGSEAAVLSGGPFGDRVASLLAAQWQTAYPPMPVSRLEQSFRISASLTVLALWRPTPALCDWADRLSFDHGRPWLPIIMDFPCLRIGPLVQPQVGPCYRCYCHRRLRHDRHQRTTALLLDKYEQDAEAGPQGYLPHHARLAAGLATLAVRRAALPQDAPRAARADVTSFDVINGRIAVDGIIALPDCDRCSPGDSGPVGADLARIVNAALAVA